VILAKNGNFEGNNRKDETELIYAEAKNPFDPK
jgi:hypothetical protein